MPDGVPSAEDASEVSLGRQSLLARNLWRAHGCKRASNQNNRVPSKEVVRGERREPEREVFSKILCTSLSHLISVCKGSLLPFTDGETRLRHRKVKALVTGRGWDPPPCFQTSTRGFLRKAGQTTGRSLSPVGLRRPIQAPASPGAQDRVWQAAGTLRAEKR